MGRMTDYCRYTSHPVLHPLHDEDSSTVDTLILHMVGTRKNLMHYYGYSRRRCVTEGDITVTTDPGGFRLH